MHPKISAVWTAVALCLIAPAAEAGRRAWPHFRAAGVIVRPGQALPEGVDPANAAVELVLKADKANLTLTSKAGARLVSVRLDAKHGRHVLITWGQRLQHYQPHVYANGKWLGWSTRSKAARKAPAGRAWADAAPARLRIDGDVEQVRVYPYAFSRPEAENAYAFFAGKTDQLKPLEVVDIRFDYRMSLGKLRVLLDVKGHFGAATGAKVTLDRPKAGKLVQTVGELPAGGGLAELDVGELPVGTFGATVEVLDRRGRVLHTAKVAFERIELPWLHNRLGLTDKVYPPFEPVKVRGRDVSCVLRKYAVSHDGLFGQIEVKGEPVLAGPARFEVAAGGREVRMQSRQALAFGRSADSATHWQAAVAGGGLTLRSNVKFEFDGLARYELTIAPSGGPVKVDRLSLAIPLKQRYGELIHALPLGGSFRSYEVARCLPAREGVIWDSKTGFVPKEIFRPTVGNFVPMVWLGGKVRGLCYVAESDKGWVPNDDKPAVTVTRKGKTITLRLNFISDTFTLERPRKIVFALVATPTRPLPKNYRVWAKGDLKTHGKVAGRLFSCDSFAPWKTKVRKGAFDFHPVDYDWARAEAAAKVMRAGPGGKYPKGQALIMYTDKAWSGDTGRDGLYFNWEWKAAGVRRSPLIWSSPSLVDCRVWYLNEYFRRDIYDGLYIDDIFPTAHYNWQTGSAYKLPDGRVQPGCSFLGLREYLKRVWNLFHIHGKQPLVTVHMTATIILPAQTFTTCTYDGEDTTRFGGKRDFLDAWPMERFHVLNDPERTGLICFFMFKGSYGQKYGKGPEAQSKVYRSVVTGWLLHDLWYQRGTVRIPGADGKYHTVPKPVIAYAGADTTFHAYWKTDLIRTKAHLKAPLAGDQVPSSWYRSYWSEVYRDRLRRNPLRASAYRRKGHLLVPVGNWAYVPVKGTVTLDLDGLGVPKDKQAGVTATDVDDWPSKEPSVDRFVWRDGKLTLTVPAHSCRLIELTW